MPHSPVRLLAALAISASVIVAACGGSTAPSASTAAAAPASSPAAGDSGVPGPIDDTTAVRFGVQKINGNIGIFLEEP